MPSLVRKSGAAPCNGHPRQGPAGHHISQVMRSVDRQQRSRVSAVHTSSSDEERVLMRALETVHGEILIKSFVVKFAARLMQGSGGGAGEGVRG